MKKITLFTVAALAFIGFAGCKRVEAVTAVSPKEESDFASLCQTHLAAIDISEFSDGFNHARFEFKDNIPDWPLYDTDQILGFAENMVYLQNPDGGWAKNLDYQRIFTLSELKTLQKQNKKVPAVTYKLKTSEDGSTMDNENIYTQIKYLCQVYAQVKDNPSIDSKRYIDCAERALNWILNAQNPVSGGFTGSDVYAITYNDHVMSKALRTLRDIARDDSLYGVFPAEARTKAEEGYKKGIECILKTQITVTLKDGTKLLTAWCQQHDHDTLEPIWAREYEMPSICSAESYDVVRLLMADQNPTEEIKNAINSACAFFDRDDVRIHGKKLVKVPHEPVTLNNKPYDYERVLVDDASAPDLWARFYALDSSFDYTIGARKPVQGTYPDVLQPVWCNRGCVFVPAYNDIDVERRNGYAYVNGNGQKLLNEYKLWKEKFNK